MTSARPSFASCLILLALFRVLTCTAGTVTSEQCTTEAWNAFNKKDWEAAISAAQVCVREFQSGADVIQDALKQRGEEAPDVDEINRWLQDPKISEGEKERLRRRYLSRGPLNDIPTCFWIIGRSSEELGNVEEAIDAYRQASQYKYGLTWDPKGGFFWPAAADADARGRRLEERLK